MTNTERPSRRTLHMITAQLWAKRSLCKRASVGCLITSYDHKRVESFGYNGPARTVVHNNCRGTPSMCLCLHAEENALLKLRGYLDPMNLYTTVFPCYMCAQRIVQVEDIRRVFYWQNYRDEAKSRSLLLNANIEIVQVDPNPIP